MKFSHWCAGFLAIVAGVLGTANLFFASPGEGWPLFHEYHGLNSLFGESERKVELDQQLAEALARNSAKEKIASRIEAGEMTLMEAAAIFAQLDEMSPGAQFFRDKISGTSEEEKQCRHVIRWMVLRATYNRSAEEGTRLRRRLEAELQDYLDRTSGAAELPVERDSAEVE